MGTTCGCGHTEIIVFRPCGHSLCVNPCFETFVKQAGIPLEVKTMTSTMEGKEVTFQVVGQRNVNLDLSESDVACPMCRQKIHRTFRVEDVFYKNWDDVTKKLDACVQDLLKKCVLDE